MVRTWVLEMETRRGHGEGEEELARRGRLEGRGEGIVRVGTGTEEERGVSGGWESWAGNWTDLP